eukprot:TRINITY_DN5050_c1_g1_i1.p1 TRINITY_DN5050_c1_g1~~TRINITY_DN5050_c1_g1_i1.p1  ORF type:complete len:503 (-),score=105.78 TRINITY_DN5050_c1_g1_i1:182-1690(-)
MFEDHLYKFGGTQEGEIRNDLQRYSIAKNEWRDLKQTGEIPSGRWGQSVALIGHVMYLFGGFGSTWCHDFYSLNLNTFRWQQIGEGSLPSPRQFASMCAYNGKLYLFGGLNSTSLSDLHCYDPQASSWSQLRVDASVIGRQRHQASVMNGVMVIHGGQDESGTRQDIALYDIESGIWSGFQPSPSDTSHSVHLGRRHLLFQWNWIDRKIDEISVSDMQVFEPGVFDSLPRDILLVIFSDLSAEDLGRVTRVNKFFRDLGLSENLWRNHLLGIVDRTKIKFYDEEFEIFKLKNNGYYFNGYLKTLKEMMKFVSEERKLEISKSVSVDWNIRVTILGADGVGRNTMKTFSVQDPLSFSYDVREPVQKHSQCRPPFILELIDGEQQLFSWKDQCLLYGDVFVIVYNVSDRSSFDQVLSSFEHIRRVRESDQDIICLVGNKIDLKIRSVSYEEGMLLANKFNSGFVEMASDASGMEIIEQVGWRYIDSKLRRRSKLQKEKKKCNVM